ncbi:hypothetical protein ACMSDV_25575, partial [Bacteroides thetaiotaomicron]|uniref:hypothetical protein n=1 Tax=Bacteroides thetaiotaomicron TaxID=818 RepID=UPI0039C47873
MEVYRCEVGKIEKYSTDTYIQKILPKYGKCLYEDKGYMVADKMAIDTTGYKEEASIKQIQIRNNVLKYYNPICRKRLISTHPKRGYPFTFHALYPNGDAKLVIIFYFRMVCHCF